MALARYAVAKVEIYTTTYCPFCTRAKSLLKSKNIAFVEIDVTEDDALREKMIELSGGRRSVPEIFINGKIVGGFDELKALNDAGKLDGRLAESAASAGILDSQKSRAASCPSPTLSDHPACDA